ncbi:hypothetical protein Dimus_038847 [Dionaea muscipula]
MDDELDALRSNDTWELVECLTSIKLIGSKWVYSVKLKSDGSLDRYKARLVALGNCQEYGINYEETFAPVAKLTIVRILLALVASQDWILHQMDVKNDFLHGYLNEEVYMKPPPGLSLPKLGLVCKLKRSLYGLKQDPRAWFDKFHNTLHHLLFVQSKSDPSLFIRKTAKGGVFLLVYVDNILITGPDPEIIKELQAALHHSFHMKDLGSLTYFLGLEVHRSNKGIFLN